ncbi:DNA repair protein RecO [Lignipirellula cremea]|uniref:DNA repair protein RecO n=1 Tax=Lignipirellula cremea TaxID=2528010 RepID=A0A518DZ24_9BACT|nr:DNA repair protein RecO [Lignipirellula cremea]QDU97065.1 DNA repair protein RecO [Lignipirellula cremea]
MASEKTTAIVVRLIEFSESSLVTTLFTRDFGKISGLAKGARRPKSAFEGALDLLAVIRIVFLHKSSDVLDLLTEAKLDRSFRAARRDLKRLHAGYYVAELLNELTDAGDPHPELFDAADEALREIDGDGEVNRVVFRFELTALDLLGHLPALHECAGCGEELETRERYPFGQLSGGLLCPTCRSRHRQVASVSAAVIEVMRTFSHLENENWRTAPLPPKVQGELRGLMNHYLNNLAGKRLKMHAFLQEDRSAT